MNRKPRAILTRKYSRRDVLSAGVAASFLPLASVANQLGLTPSQTAGPFYPNWAQSDRDADLTKINGNANQAVGEPIEVSGQVLSAEMEPIVGASIEVWQANAHGRYAHEADRNTAPLDKNFQGWAQLKTDAEGFYRFKTIVPGAYPVSRSWSRPPHIHFKVSGRGYLSLTTQMYFAGHPLNETDGLLLQHPASERRKLVVEFREQKSVFEKGRVSSGVFNIVLNRAG